MPIYEYRCRACECLTDKYFPDTNAPVALLCKHCGSLDTHRIVSGAVYHASEATKTSKLDPKYEKMVDQAMRKSSSADPERLLRKMRPFPKKP
jgi:putative FmdB family regulatory protein